MTTVGLDRIQPTTVGCWTCGSLDRVGAMKREVVDGREVWTHEGGCP